MQKRKKLNYSIGICQVFLLILYSFAIAFILQENLVSGRGEFIPSAAVPKPGLGGAIAPAVDGLGTPPVQGGASSLLQTGSEMNSGVFSEAAIEIAAERVAAEATLEDTYCASLGPLGCIGGEIFGSGPWGFFGAHLIEGVVWGGVVALGIKFLGPMLGLEDEQADAAAAFGGIIN